DTVDHRFGIDADVYYIDWSDIQVEESQSGFSFIGNAPGGATSQGVELALSANPTNALAMSSAIAYQRAYLREANAALGATAGEPLPNAPLFTTTLNADYRIVNSSLRPTVGGTFRYADARDGFFLPTPRFSLPAYTTL